MGGRFNGHPAVEEENQQTLTCIEIKSNKCPSNPKMKKKLHSLGSQFFMKKGKVVRFTWVKNQTGEKKLLLSKKKERERDRGPQGRKRGLASLRIAWEGHRQKVMSLTQRRTAG